MGFLWFGKKKYKGPRIIHINEREKNKIFKYPNNVVKTSKYEWWNFIPKNLFEQFKRIANIYFFIISCLQVFTPLSPTGRWGTAIPLIIVLLVTMLKDGYEDAKRHIADLEVNNSKTQVIRDGKLRTVRWRDIRVGDIVRVENKQFFPADLVVLSSNDHQGLCFIETASLDGETNLKIRRALAETFHLRTEEQVAALKARIECEQPNNRLYNFDGTLELNYDSAQPVKVPLSPDQILLRGAQLRNTDWIYGIVIFTGRETKLMQNARKAPHKRSRVERKTNIQIIQIFLLEIIISIVCAIGIGIWARFAIGDSLQKPDKWYLRFTENAPIQGVLGFITFFILFNNFIPISLYVSLETVKVFQARFIESDVKMYHEETNTPAIARTSSLNEELGQVEYIFSDKTGTLTRNKMEFLKCSIAGESYGKGTTEIGRAAAKRMGVELKDDRPPNWDSKSEFQFYDPRLTDGNWKRERNAANIRDFFTLLAVCHTVIPEVNKETGELIYQAASPDEGALVSAAKHFGFKFHTRTHKSITITADGTEETYQILNVLEFNSNRKRMSVICRDPRGRLVLMCKGADVVIYPRLAPHQRYVEVTKAHLKQFAEDGLRTLICARAFLDEGRYKAWNVKFNEAACALKDKEAKLEAVAEEIEVNMELVGATAIEDKLQEGVPDCISTLSEAGIRIWVLTGDKQETAINIGFACALLDNDMKIMIFNQEKKDDLLAAIHDNLQTARAIRDHPDPDERQDLGVVIDGFALGLVLSDAETQLRFLELGMMCKSVICCRVTPKQKAQVVLLVKQNLPAVTLSIGDGANDVPMIQSAHIGIGISGNEGLQAARASDYAIAQFRFLKRLLLVHGRWNYRRNSKLIMYSFYKNMLLQLTQFYFVFFNGYSGTSLYDQYILPLFNIIFTALPILSLAILDKDVSDEQAEQFPSLYLQGLRDHYFNVKVFWQWAFSAIWQSLVVFFVPFLCIRYAMFGAGHELDLQFFGVLMYLCVLFVVTIRIATETLNWNIIHFIITWGSFLVFPAYMFLIGVVPLVFPMSFINNPTFSFVSILHDYNIMIYLVTSPTFWMTVILTLAIASFRDVFWKCFKSNYRRELYHVLRQHPEATKADVLERAPSAIQGKEHFPQRKIKQKLDLRQVPKKFVGLLNKEPTDAYTGFAFNQSPGQMELIEQVTKGSEVKGQNAARSPSSPRSGNTSPAPQSFPPPSSPVSLSRSSMSPTSLEAVIPINNSRYNSLNVTDLIHVSINSAPNSPHLSSRSADPSNGRTPLIRHNNTGSPDILI